MKKKREIIDITLSFFGGLLFTYFLIFFNNNIVRSLPLEIRMPILIVSYWFVALIPIVIMLMRKEKPSDYGFAKNNLFKQILIGVGIGLAFSFVFTLIPHLIGFGDWVNNGTSYRYLWQFCYEFVYCIFAVGITEEFIFRGFLFEKIKRISNTAVAIIISSILFGLFHIFAGNVIQVVATALLGILFCLCKEKIKYCSILSLIIAHGIYDALISVFVFLFNK